MNSLKNLLFISSKESNPGYLILRIFFGVALFIHGYPKMFGGIEKWRALGGAMNQLGVGFFPAFWGFMAAFAEFFGGIFLILGLFTTINAFLVFFTMLVAAFFVHGGDPFKVRELALVYFFCSILYMMKGAGKYSIDYYLFGKGRMYR